jgi:hypothetical protein
MFNAWLHQFSNITVGLMIVTFGLTISTLIPICMRRRYDWNPPDAIAKGADESFKLFTSLTLMLLAFCFVRAQTDHRNVEDLVSREATIIYKLNHALESYGGDQALALQQKTKEYAQSIIQDEWPLLIKGQRSTKTSEILADLIEGCRELEPRNIVQQVARAEILPTITQVSDVREARLSASHLSLPVYYWQALGTSITVLLILGWFLTPIPRMAAYVGGVTFGISMLLTVLFATEGLFVGESQVTPAAISNMIPLLGG